jgi:serine/threonine protein kinase/Flp pilus assembly protein TadD
MSPSDEAAVQAPAAEEDPHVLRAVEEYQAAQRAGCAPDREQFLARHADIAAALAECLDGLDFIQAAAPRLQQSADTALAGSPPAEGLLGDFRLLREVGRGGMGVVYEAEQVSLGRRVALKVLPFAAALDARQLQRFKNEAHAAAQLHHTNIVPVYAVGCERGVHFYAMQFIDGQTLARVIADLRGQAGLDPAAPAASTGSGAAVAADLASGRWAPSSAAAETRAAASITPPGSPSGERFLRSTAYFRTAAQLGVQAAEALEHAHGLGVVHRDVKPGNLLVDGRGQLWVADFGLAQVQGDTKLTLTGDLVGTLRYMSPEQALAQRVVLDHRSDIYSLGVTLYELLTLEPAFNGRDRQELLRQIAQEEPRPPRRLNPAMPPELQTIVGKAIEKNPGDRYATAQELADDLRRYLQDEPIRARRPTLVQRARKWSRRHKTAVGAAVVVLAVLGLVVAGEWLRVLQRRAATAARVNLALSDATLLQGRENWREALGAVARAEALLADGGDDAALHERAQELRKDLEMAARLDELRLHKSHGGDASFAGGDPWAARAYGGAFAEYGIGVLTDPPEQAAAAIGARGIREQLLAALDDWILVQTDAGVRERLCAVAELADPDEWHNLLRRAVVANDRRALEELAARPEAADLPPASAHLLGQALANAGAGAKAVQVLAAAQRRHPQDFWLNYQLGLQFLWGAGVPDRPGVAAGYLRAALVARPRYSTVYVYLALALPGPEDLDEVVALNRKATELSPTYSTAHFNLGRALVHQGNYAEAEAEFREVLRLRGDDPSGHAMLGVALGSAGKPAEAEPEFRAALRRDPDVPEAHDGLGNALNDQGKPAEAEAEHRAALRLRPDFPEAHHNLGVALADQGKPAEAEAEFRVALRLRPNFPEAHDGLGNTLNDQGKRAEAEAEYREALRLRPDYAEAHCDLGRALQQQGRFTEAVEALRRGHELGSKQPNWRKPSAEWLRRAERLVALDAKLPQVLRGQAQPADAAEYIALAKLCQEYKRLYAAAARFYAGAFDDEPQLADGLRTAQRYNAACAAALAGCGRGEDAAKLEDAERARLRRQALAWLRAELAAWDQLLDKDPERARAAVQQALRHWQEDADLAGVRGDALAELPEAERRPWQQLWADVEQTLRRANPKDTKDAKKTSSDRGLSLSRPCPCEA